MRRIAAAALAACLAGTSVPAAAQPGGSGNSAGNAQPPAVPSSYELRRLEAQIRGVLAARGAEARRKSRQIEASGTGTAVGAGEDAGFAFDISTKQAVGLGLIGLVGAVAATALSAESSPIVGGGGSGGGGASGTTTTTGTR